MEYHPKPSKTWLIVKEEFVDLAKRLFPDLTSKSGELNITTEGHKYLGSYIGTKEGKTEFMKKQIQSWEDDIRSLTEIASREPQLAYSAFLFGASKRWTFVARTTPDITEDLKKLDWLISETFVPALIGKEYVTDTMRDVFRLPAKLGGLGISNISQTADLEYKNSLHMTEELTDLIYKQGSSMDLDQKRMEKAKVEIKKQNHNFHQSRRDELYQKMQPSEQRQLDLASEKGASSWLTSLPLSQYGFLLNKQEFHDALLLRWNTLRL